MQELAFRSAVELAALVRAGAVTPVELVELYLERIERLDPQLNAFVTVAAEQALVDARVPRPGLLTNSNVPPDCSTLSRMPTIP